MQDPAAFQAMKLPASASAQFPEQEQLKCPRCESLNTKFCYYNNYNLSQPRHFCKNCRRYWTKGGALRNIPVGGGTRKAAAAAAAAAASGKRAANPKRAARSQEPPPPQAIFMGAPPGAGAAAAGSFSSLLASDGVGGFEGIGQVGPRGVAGRDDMSGRVGSGSVPDGYLGLQSGDWGGGGGNGWPDLAIYTPGSSFQ